MYNAEYNGLPPEVKELISLAKEITGAEPGDLTNKNIETFKVKLKKISYPSLLLADKSGRQLVEWARMIGNQDILDMIYNIIEKHYQAHNIKVDRIMKYPNSVILGKNYLDPIYHNSTYPNFYSMTKAPTVPYAEKEKLQIQELQEWWGYTCSINYYDCLYDKLEKATYPNQVALSCRENLMYRSMLYWASYCNQSQDKIKALFKNKQITLEICPKFKREVESRKDPGPFIKRDILGTITMQDAPLCYAAKYGQHNLMEFLINQDPRFLGQVTNEDAEPAVDYSLRWHGHFGETTGVTPLMLAVKAGNLECVNFLLLKEVDCNAVNMQNDTALHYAARHGQDTVIDNLIAAGARIDRRNRQGRCPIHEAANAGHLKVIEKMLEHDKTLIEQVDNHGQTPCASGEAAIILQVQDLL